MNHKAMGYAGRSLDIRTKEHLRNVAIIYICSVLMFFCLKGLVKVLLSYCLEFTTPFVRFP